MIFHYLQLQLKGSMKNFCDINKNLDVADEFSSIARSLGFEGTQDTFAGLWTTQPVYNGYSLFRENFFDKGLYLDLLCDSNFRIPFSEIFLCLGETLRQVGTFNLSQVAVLCEPYSVKMFVKNEKIIGSLNLFSNIVNEGNPLPLVNFSSLHIEIIDKKNSDILCNKISLTDSQCTLPELAFPFSIAWSHWEASIPHVEKIKIVLN